MAKLTVTFVVKKKRFVKVILVCWYVTRKLGLKRLSDELFNLAFEIKLQ